MTTFRRKVFGGIRQKCDDVRVGMCVSGETRSLEGEGSEEYVPYVPYDSGRLGKYSVVILHYSSWILGSLMMMIQSSCVVATVAFVRVEALGDSEMANAYGDGDGVPRAKGLGSCKCMKT